MEEKTPCQPGSLQRRGLSLQPKYIPCKFVVMQEYTKHAMIKQIYVIYKKTKHIYKKKSSFMTSHIN